MSDPVQLRTTRPAPGCVVLYVAGELDLVTAPDLEAELVRQLADAPAQLVLELSGVAFFGSLGLAAIIRARELAAERGVRLAVVLNRLVRRTMELTGTLELFAVYESLDAAVGGWNGD